MLLFVMPDAIAYRSVEEDDLDIAPFYVFAECVKLYDDPHTDLNAVVAKLGNETGAIESHATGFTEGTFYFNTKLAVLKARTHINRHVAKITKEADERQRRARAKS